MFYYSPSTCGFYTHNVHKDNVPPDAVEITAEQHSALMEGQSHGKRIVSDADGLPILIDPPIPTPQVPEKVTMRQARLALHFANLLTSVQTALEALPEPDRTTAMIEWDYASDVYRSSDLISVLGDALELSAEEFDNLFFTAATL